MRLFPVLEIEPIIQENDKTRLDARKSFLSGSSAAVTMKIKPSSFEDYLDVTDARYLDWAYGFEIEVDSSNNVVAFTEDDIDRTCTIPSGTYTLSDLAEAIADAMTDEGAQAYAGQISNANEFVFTGDGALAFTLTIGGSSLLPEIGFAEDAESDDDISVTGTPVETVTAQVTMRQDAAITIAEDENDKVDFEIAATAYVAQIEAGDYATLGDLAAAIQTAMDALAVPTATFSITEASGIVTFASNLALELKPETGANVGESALALVGITEDDQLVGEAVDSVKIKTATMTVISELADDLYSDDQGMRTHEPDILQYVADGRATFKDIHRRAQSLILDWVNKQGWVDSNGDKITKEHVLDHTEVQEWSTFMALKLVFQSNINSIKDIFDQKAKTYEDCEVQARKRLVLRLDLNKDGSSAQREQITPFQSAFVVRR